MAKPYNDPAPDPGQDFMRRLAKAVKRIGLIVTVTVITFIGIQTDNVTGSFGYPIIYTATAIGCFLAGWTFRK